MNIWTASKADQTLQWLCDYVYLSGPKMLNKNLQHILLDLETIQE